MSNALAQPPGDQEADQHCSDRDDKAFAQAYDKPFEHAVCPSQEDDLTDIAAVMLDSDGNFGTLTKELRQDMRTALAPPGPDVVDQARACPGFDQKSACGRLNAGVFNIWHLADRTQSVERTLYVGLGRGFRGHRRDDAGRGIETRGFEGDFALAVTPSQHAGYRRDGNDNDGNDQPSEASA
jgi:hypothetical protein